MSVSTELAALQTDITNARTAITNKGGTVASGGGSSQLASDIATIPSGGWTRPSDAPNLDLVNELKPNSGWNGYYFTFNLEETVEYGILRFGYNFSSITEVSINNDGSVSTIQTLSCNMGWSSFSVGWHTIRCENPSRGTVEMYPLENGTVLYGLCEVYVHMSEYHSPEAYANIPFEHYRIIDANPSAGKTWFALFGTMSVKKIDFINCDASNIENAVRMFEYTTCLEELNCDGLSNFRPVNCSQMFSNCGARSLDVSFIDTSRCTNVREMFFCCAVNDLDLSMFDTHLVTDFSNMFRAATALKTINMSSFNFENATTIGRMFFAVTTLHKITFPDNLQHSYDGRTWTSSNNVDVIDSEGYWFYNGAIPQTIENFLAFKTSFALRGWELSYLKISSVMSIINALPEVATAQTCTLGSTNLNKLTSEQRAIATGKGWTLA